MKQSKNLKRYSLPIVILSAFMAIISILSINLFIVSSIKSSSSLKPLLDSKIFSVKTLDNGLIKITRYEAQYSNTSTAISNSNFVDAESLGMYTVIVGANIAPVKN